MEDKRYLKIFSSQSDYESQKDEVMGMPHVVLLDDTKEVVFASENKENEIDYASQPFTLVALEDGTMDIGMPSGATFMNYSLNDGDWVENTEDIVLEVKANDKVKLKANPMSLASDSYKIFDLSMPFNAEGNIMSLLYGDDFQDKKTIECERCFAFTFRGTNIVSAKNLILPATTLASECYSGMFDGCTSLVEAPQLPATTLTDGCYYRMFYGANVLPDCSNIDFTSESVVASGGLKGLFAGTKVTDADLEQILPKNDEGKYCLPTTTLANRCYYSMFRDCTSLTTAPELPATTLADFCYSYMFNGCTSLTEAPELLATTLADYCYQCMFWNCSELNKITMLATNISTSSCLYSWVEGVASSGTFIKHGNMTTLPRGIHGIPNGWTVENA